MVSPEAGSAPAGATRQSHPTRAGKAPRVVILSLASDYGCQVQMTNIEDQLLDVLSLIDLTYWQLASSGEMPEAYDVAIIEGAVTTKEHATLLRSVRDTASIVMAIGACAVTGGIPALAREDLESRRAAVYGEASPLFAREIVPPSPVSSVIGVDYVVPGCPIDTEEFFSVLSRALLGLRDKTPEEPMCASCKIRENVCFIERDTPCLGVITRMGCGARCPTLGRACTGCRGVAEDANLEAARRVFAEHGWDLFEAGRAIGLYNSAEEVSR
jgi:sulfhydrogenase subunit delta